MFTFKILVAGDKHVGKTSIIQNLGRILPTNTGPISFTFFETSNPFDNWTGKIDAAIIVFDTTNKHTYQQIPEWEAAIQKFGKPIAIVGNKVDCKNQQVLPSRANEEIHFVSAKSGYQISVPFLELVKNLTYNPYLYIVYQLTPEEKMWEEEMNSLQIPDGVEYFENYEGYNLLLTGA